MTRDIISVQYPKMDSSQSIADTKITKQAVTAANGITLEGAFDNKNNSLVLIIENTATTASNITFKAGDNYPNAKLGNLTRDVDASSVNVYQ